MTPGAARIEALAHRRGTTATVHDWVADEVPVALQFNGISHTVMLATPCDLEDFALGFSLTEGIIDGIEDFRDFDTAAACLEGGEGVVADISISGRCISRLKEQRRTLVGRTGCGLCGTDNLAHAMRDVESPVRPPAIDPAVLQRAYAQMGQVQTLQRATGATHAAGWCEPDGTLRLLREDVGRHNALDKLIGALARARIDATPGFVVVTSRASYEMVHKTATAGIGLLAAISAPTALAIRLADEAGLCLMGFVRGADWVAYTHAEALRGTTAGATPA